ncbi:MAG: bifunctional glutamate N-acetyltransferase/amino-acid acetyltransferase ArgJ [Oscillospiraceae bacterium]|nr:bifunctional glutamate N-acetyltransferase/amino-acid acetyltransferase ArgJ [Oscillospiraceae bacterium]
MKFIDGGICAASGFFASGMHCGVKSKKPDKKDVALIYSRSVCSASAVYTKNVVKAAPLHITREHLKDGKLRAIIANSGNANACAPYGEQNAESCCEAVAKELNISAFDVAVASTGVIGQTLPAGVIIGGIPTLVATLKNDAEASDSAAAAIMTTDTVKKECAIETVIGGKTVHIGGIAKGSGMIHPNMGTMLCFITTDCAISSEMIKKALVEAANVSFNRISVDGDTSTNDMCILMANGEAGNAEICDKNEDYAVFIEALSEMAATLARKMASDGEGATHLITCTVKGAASVTDAESISKSVIASSLVKAAIFGADANWGRVLCAMGYSGAQFDPETVSVAFRSAAGAITVCADGRGLAFDEDAAKKILLEHDVFIDITMDGGDSECTCWGCDMTYDYVRINGDYRT